MLRKQWVLTSQWGLSHILPLSLRAEQQGIISAVCHTDTEKLTADSAHQQNNHVSKRHLLHCFGSFHKWAKRKQPSHISTGRPLTATMASLICF